SVDAFDPPAAQCAPKTSPSVVTARSSGCSLTSAIAETKPSTTATSCSAARTADCSRSGACTTSTAHRAPDGNDGRPGKPGSSAPPSKMPARPESCVFRYSNADTASSPACTATASATGPNAAAIAASKPGSTVSNAATEPSTPGSSSP